jgi:hypothetical protein
MTAVPQGMDGGRIVRLLAVARGLEDEGQYNAAKLFRAVAFGEGFRATRDRPRAGRGLERAATEAVAELRAGGYGGELVSAMERALAAVRAGQWPTLEEVPRTFVCRNCGEVLLGEPPATCPTCRARVLTYQEVQAMYFLEPLGVGELLATLAAASAEMQRLCAGVSEEQAGRGRWPMREIVAHLLGAERLLVGRAIRMLEEDDPELLSSSPPFEGGSDLAGLVEAFRAARDRTLRRFEALTSDQWRRTGRHPEWGRLTLLQQLSWLARHEQSHLAELEQRRIEA